MKTRVAQESDLAEWLRLRRALWSDHDPETLLREARAIIASDAEVCYLADGEPTGTVGFLEGAVHVGPNGPYGHVEGWYVMPDFRRRGVGRQLVASFELWCLHRTICLLTSDTDPDSYLLSPPAHIGCGFRQIAELRIFAKELVPGRADLGSAETTSSATGA